VGIIALCVKTGRPGNSLGMYSSNRIRPPKAVLLGPSLKVDDFLIRCINRGEQA
jgi:hypothetical protein